MSSSETNNENVETSELIQDAEPAIEVNAEEAVQQEEFADAALHDEIARLKDQFVRSQAEMENVRRRAELDVEKAHKFALERFSKELLPVADSLEKTLESVKGDDELMAGVREGVNLTLNILMSALGKFNIEQIDPVGEPFDPQVHEAMSMIDAPGAEPNSVIAVMQKGYLLNGRLVRPAMVMVSKAAAPGSTINEKA
ncbi:MAG: nucleotide exchange factor GrpE [Hahellaceae bacterium]|nr:nucleotide exchange factor GrpE [Hahellaceae bacterium]